MLAKIKALFEVVEQPATKSELNEEQKRLACAALLVEVAVADHHFDDTELASLRKILGQQFAIEAALIDEFVSLAKQESENATSLYQFTRLINDHCSAEEKFDLVKAMWAIAYADGDLDKYEEYVIRKVSDLIYLGKSEFVRAKHAYLADRG